MQTSGFPDLAIAGPVSVGTVSWNKEAGAACTLGMCSAIPCLPSLVYVTILTLECT